MIMRGITVLCDNCGIFVAFKGPQRSNDAVQEALSKSGWLICPWEKITAGVRITKTLEQLAQVCPECMNDAAAGLTP
jgi:hypothetical protein